MPPCRTNIGRWSYERGAGSVYWRAIDVKTATAKANAMTRARRCSNFPGRFRAYRLAEFVNRVANFARVTSRLFLKGISEIPRVEFTYEILP